MTAFTDHVQGYLGGLSGTVGWDINSLNLVVSDALLLYGVSTEADATDTTKAYALLDYCAARRILREASMNHDYSADGESFSLSQVPESVAKFLLNEAWTVAFHYLPEGSTEVGSIDFGFDPYKRSNL